MLHYIAVIGPFSEAVRPVANQIAERYKRKLALEGDVHTRHLPDGCVTQGSAFFGESSLAEQAHRLLDNAAVMERAYRQGGPWVFDFSLDARMEIYIKAMRKMGVLSADDYLLLARIYGEIKARPSARTPDIIVRVLPEETQWANLEPSIPLTQFSSTEQHGIIQELYGRFAKTCESESWVTVIDFPVDRNCAPWGLLDDLIGQRISSQHVDNPIPY